MNLLLLFAALGSMRMINSFVARRGPSRKHLINSLVLGSRDRMVKCAMSGSNSTVINTHRKRVTWKLELASKDMGVDESEVHTAPERATQSSFRDRPAIDNREMSRPDTFPSSDAFVQKWSRPIPRDREVVTEKALYSRPLVPSGNRPPPQTYTSGMPVAGAADSRPYSRPLVPNGNRAPPQTYTSGMPVAGAADSRPYSRPLVPNGNRPPPQTYASMSDGSPKNTAGTGAADSRDTIELSPRASLSKRVSVSVAVRKSPDNSPSPAGTPAGTEKVKEVYPTNPDLETATEDTIQSTANTTVVKEIDERLIPDEDFKITIVTTAEQARKGVCVCVCVCVCVRERDTHTHTQRNSFQTVLHHF